MNRSNSPIILALLFGMTIALVIVSGCTYLSIPNQMKFGSSQNQSPTGPQSGDSVIANYPSFSESNSSGNGPASQTCPANTDFSTDSNNCGACGAQCPSHSTCGGGGQCSCNPGYTAQNSQCVVSGSGTSSQNTGGGLTCPPSHTLCQDNICSDFTSDPNHCGSCTNSCQSDQTCTNGQCGIGGLQVQGGGPTCSVTFATYNPEVNAELYIDNSDTGHTTPYVLDIQSGDHTATFKKVGYYDKSMPFTVNAPTSGGICSQAIIVPMTSESGTTTVTSVSDGGSCGNNNEGTFCSGQCVNLKVSNLFCGKCSNKCPPKTSCVNGQCTPTSCSDGDTMCSGKCDNLEFCPYLPYNCGGCGQKCPPGKRCLFGFCQPLNCWPGFHVCSDYFCCKDGSDNLCAQDQYKKPDYSFCMNECTSKIGCDNACKDFKTDITNCGSCGNNCPSGQTCQNGVCQSTSVVIVAKPKINVPIKVPICTSSTTLCSGICVNTQTDNYNCGTCGNICSNSSICSNGVCNTLKQVVSIKPIIRIR